MARKLKRCSCLRGVVVPPGDKSISHRTVIFNSIAQGKASITHFSPGADCLSTVACLKSLGGRIEKRNQDALEVEGLGWWGLREAEDVLNAGNSGTTMRLLAGLLAAQPFFSILTGDSSLRSRPMGRLIQPLRLMGAEIWSRGKDSLAPLAIKGKELKGITYRLPVSSAQIKSALLIAGLWAQGETTVIEPDSSRDHTERMLQAMGAKLNIDGNTITLRPQTVPLVSLNLHIPGDISSAAYWLVAGAIHPDAQIKIINTGVNPTRTGILDVLWEMGARLEVENEHWSGGEPVADLIIQSSELRGVNIGGGLIPRLIDEIPVLAVAACVAQGVTVIRDAAELRVKESDRISTTREELSRLGAEIEELPDGMVIHGGRKLIGAECDSHQDHRLAMSLGVASLVAQGETVVQNAEAVDISYPTFWEERENLCQKSRRGCSLN